MRFSQTDQQGWYNPSELAAAVIYNNSTKKIRYVKWVFLIPFPFDDF